MGNDANSDGEERVADATSVCTVHTVRVISQHLQLTNTGLLAKESSKDLVISTVMHHVWEGWPHTIESDGV